jgi:hypothetical protein
VVRYAVIGHGRWDAAGPAGRLRGTNFGSCFPPLKEIPHIRVPAD